RPKAASGNKLSLDEVERMREQRSGPDVGGHDHHRPGKESKTQWRTQPSTPPCILLDRHQCSKREHPADIASADDEHQQHDRPAAADAECAMMDAEPKGIAPRGGSVPVLNYEAERCAA